jgi:hypothetical protein
MKNKLIIGIILSLVIAHTPVSAGTNQPKAPSQKFVENDRYSPWLAAGLNAILPSAGFFYSQSYGWAAAEIVVLAAGITFMAIGANKSKAGNERCRRSGGECWDDLAGLGDALLGAGIFSIGYLGGIAIAPVVASSKNSEIMLDQMRSGGDAPSSLKDADTFGAKLTIGF